MTVTCSAPEPKRSPSSLVLGIDPGSSRVGWAALELGSAHARHVASGTIAVDLAAGDAGLAALRTAAAGLLARIGPTLVALERIERVHGSRYMGAALASGLALSQWVGAELAGLAAAQGFPVRTVTRERARAALGLTRRGATDADVATAIRAQVAAWPIRSTEHARDAAAVAMLAGAPLERCSALVDASPPAKPRPPDLTFSPAHASESPER